ncbi:MAG: DUF5777 family beta-barrel protein [Balneolales bacterium]
MKTTFFPVGVLVLCITGFVLTTPSNAQLPRERVEQDPVVDDVFWAPTNIGISTVHTISSRNLNTSVAHTLGLVGGGIERFYGLDDGANTRIGLDYGISDQFSLGIGRMTLNKVVDIRARYSLLHQTVSGSKPVEIAVKASTGISTLSGLGMAFSDRLSYFTSLMIARKMNRMSIQLSPMMAYFNTPGGDDQDQLFGIGILSSYELSERYALSAEYLPVFGQRNQDTSDAMALALNINTGGHVFQVFLTSFQWHNEQFIMAQNRDRFWEGNFRLGFNIHRVFGI